MEQLDEALRLLSRERDELLAELAEAREIEREHNEINAVLQQRAEEVAQADRSFSHTASQV